MKAHLGNIFHQHKKNALLLTVMCVLALMNTSTLKLPVPVIASQSQDRVVTNLRRRPMPVEIKVVKTKKGAAEIGRTFSGEDDWFKELTVDIENTSGKTIIYIGGGFLFPRSKDQGIEQQAPPNYYSFMYGQHPLAPEKARAAHQPLSVKPGETFKAAIPESDFKSLKQKLRELGYPASIREININIEEIYFDDGTAWGGGVWLQRDPNSPEKYAPVKEAPPNKLGLKIEGDGLSRS